MAEPTPAPSVLVICADLMTGGRLVSAVAAAGGTPVRVLSVAKAAAHDGPAAAVLDLTLAGAADWLADATLPVVAFAPHVRTDLLRRAREAARGPVLVRSQLEGEVACRAPRDDHGPFVVRGFSLARERSERGLPDR